MDDGYDVDFPRALDPEDTEGADGGEEGEEPVEGDEFEAGDAEE